MNEQEELMIKIHADHGFQFDRFVVTIPKGTREKFCAELKKFTKEFAEELQEETNK